MEKHYKRWLIVAASIAFVVLATRRIDSPFDEPTR
jgi:hypothetical protein